MERTLTIDDDVLEAAEEMAERQGVSVDRMISALSRKGLASSSQRTFRKAFPGLPARGVGPITLEFVNELRDGTAE